MLQKTAAFVLIFSAVLFANGFSQNLTKRVVFLKNKQGTSFSITNPSAYLSARAIEKRQRYNIAIDSFDLPVVQAYIDSIANAGNVIILGRSKWLNAVYIQTTDNNALAKINSFPFVKTLNQVAYRLAPGLPNADKFGKVRSNGELPTGRFQRLLTDSFNYGFANIQIKIHNGDLLHNLGARGKGMRMAFADAGFTGYLTNLFFDSARLRNQFLGSWDFVDRDPAVNTEHPHGLNCFSIVAGYQPGTFVGSAPEAGYYLLRTEDAGSEQIIEEYFWASGAEYADSAGVDVMSVSLGYSTYDNSLFNHSYADMNGNTTVITRMADLAARKGMLVVVSAGNEGGSSWKFITAPADADSVLTVGAVNMSGGIASFSSFGPTSDGRIKPDVVSIGNGTVLSATNGVLTTGSGTSFSAPNLAGLATCLWQLFPEVNNMQLIAALRNSSDRFANPHPQYGFGLPDMKKAVGFLLSAAVDFKGILSDCAGILTWTSKDKKGMQYELQRKFPDETTFVTIETIHAKGTAFSNQSYTYIDTAAKPVPGLLQYRLVQVIDSSSSSKLSVVLDTITINQTVTCTKPTNTKAKLLLYPNPASNTIHVKFIDQATGNFKLQVYNRQGQLLQQEMVAKPEGLYVHSMSINHLPKGSYIIKCVSNGKQYDAEEFVKQ
jgi:hypothetical protein